MGAQKGFAQALGTPALPEHLLFLWLKMLESVAGRIIIYHPHPTPTFDSRFLSFAFFFPLKCKLFSLRLHCIAWKAHLLTAPGIRADTLLMERVCGRE